MLDYITLNEHFAVLIGGRHSKFANTLAGFEDDDFSLRGGVVYTPRDKLSLAKFKPRVSSLKSPGRLPMPGACKAAMHT